jgi:hypothetical protein
MIASVVVGHFWPASTPTLTPTVDPPKQERQLATPGAEAWVIKSCDVDGRLYWGSPARPDQTTCSADLKDTEEVFKRFADDLQVNPGHHCPTPRDECVKVTLDDRGRLPKL